MGVSATRDKNIKTRRGNVKKSTAKGRSPQQVTSPQSPVQTLQLGNNLTGSRTPKPFQNCKTRFTSSTVFIPIYRYKRNVPVNLYFWGLMNISKYSNRILVVPNINCRYPNPQFPIRPWSWPPRNCRECNCRAGKGVTCVQGTRWVPPSPDAKARDKISRGEKTRFISESFTARKTR